MVSKNNVSKMNISFVDLMSSTNEYEAMMLINDDAIDQEDQTTTDPIIATFLTRLDITGKMPSLICLVDKQLYPISFTSINRNQIRKLFGSVTNFLNSVPEVLVKSGLLEGHNVTYVTGSLGVYRGKVTKANEVSLYRDNDIVSSYKVIGISEALYRGTEFRFVRYAGKKHLERVDLINRLSDEDFAELVNRNDDDDIQESDVEVAILVPINQRKFQSNRIRHKQNKSKLANRSLRQCFSKYPYFPNCGNVKVLLADIYAEKYTELKQEKQNANENERSF